MQTRQTKRKTITLAGRYVPGPGGAVDVKVNDLSPRGCRFAVAAPQPGIGSRVQLYLEGSGPHFALVKWVRKGEVGVTFIAPLSDELFSKFQNTHVPALDVERTAEAFALSPKGAPTRFC